MPDTMENNSSRSVSVLCFVAGINAAIAVSVLGNVAEFFFVGDAIVCQSSFPRYHKACVYSRFGIGEQAVTLRIDDETVFSVEDFPGGNLNERITWDKSGQVVTFYVDGLGKQVYDAETKNRLR